MVLVAPVMVLAEDPAVPTVLVEPLAVKLLVTPSVPPTAVFPDPSATVNLPESILRPPFKLVSPVTLMVPVLVSVPFMERSVAPLIAPALLMPFPPLLMPFKVELPLTLTEVKVPREVMLDCDAPVTVVAEVAEPALVA